MHASSVRQLPLYSHPLCGISSLAPCAIVHLYDNKCGTIVHLPLQGCVYVLKEGTLMAQEPGDTFNNILQHEARVPDKQKCLRCLIQTLTSRG